MPPSVAAFVEALQQLPLLDIAQRAQLDALIPDHPTPEELAAELVRREWLTAFQARVLLEDSGAELVLGEYVLLDLLGRGGVGNVYKARQGRMKRLVALKVIRHESLAHPGALKRFRREIEATARLAHPNVITIHDTGEIDGRHFLVMEYIEGTDLARLVKAQGPLPADVACEYVRQAALGLQHAHDEGLIHRDIKPHNLMRTKHGNVKLMDLGLVRAAEVTASVTGLTMAGTVVGTPNYMAPEQTLDAHAVDQRADIYALGCTLYHLLAGEPPFAGMVMSGVLVAHHVMEPRPLAEYRKDLPREVIEVVQRMMAKQPEKRYQTPLEVAAALEPFSRVVGSVRSMQLTALPPEPLKAGTPTETVEYKVPQTVTDADKQRVESESTVLPPAPKPPPPPIRPGRRRPLVLVALAVAIGLGVGYLLLAQIRRPGGGETTPDGTNVGGPLGVETLRLDLGNGIPLDLVRIKRGSFLMGAPRSEREAAEDEKPQHEVTLTQDMLLGRYPVTQEQYAQVMGKNPSWFSVKAGGKDKVAGLETLRFPVENVSWEEAQQFCAAASKLTGRRVDLPTEAEWEYACRAGTRTRYYCGNELTQKDANFDGKVGRTTEVGQYPPNAWGLYDMAGNVWQWCADGKQPYAAEARTDPVGPDNNNARLLRGGSWLARAAECRSAARYSRAASNRYYLGFRVMVRSE
jgi:serine/threonine protein kinase